MTRQIKKLKGNLEKLMDNLSVSLDDEHKVGIQGDPIDIRGKWLVTTKDTFKGWPGEADSTQLFLYNNGIMEIDMHHYSEYAAITRETCYSLDKFLENKVQKLATEDFRQLKSSVKKYLNEK